LPLMRRCRGDTRDRLREAEDRPQHYRSNVDQLTSQRVKLRSLSVLTKDDKALNHRPKHPPRTSGVGLAAKRQPRALLMKERECAGAIACIRHQPKKCSGAESA